MILLYVVFVVSGSFHECAHAWTANRLGDPTARDQGRISLNPLVHIDLFGTVIVPLIIVYASPYALGWMKPVPVFTPNLRTPVRDSLLVSLAGPFSNICLAFSGAVVVWMITLTGQSTPEWMLELQLLLVNVFIPINLLLAVFNLLPVPPLDGSSIVDYIRRDPNESWHRQGLIGVILIYALLFSGCLNIIWTAVISVEFFLLDMPYIACTLFVTAAVVVSLFSWRTKGSGQGRVVRVRKNPGSPPRMKNSLDRAYAVARSLARGEKVSAADVRWFSKIKENRGDGQPLCSPISFGMDNEFCRRCANLNRCVVREAEARAAGQESGEDGAEA